MTPKDLKDLLKDIATQSREEMLAQGRLFPTLDFVCPTDGLEAKLKARDVSGFAVGPANLPWTVVRMSAAPDPTELLEQFARFGDRSGKFERVLTLGRAVGLETLGNDEEKIDRHILNAMCTAMKCMDKDVLSLNIAGAIRHFEAYAFIKRDEAWQLQFSGRTKEQLVEERKQCGEIKDHPDRIEVLMVTLETRKGAWAYCLKVQREGPGDESAKLIGVEELPPEPMGGGDGMDFEGRFFGFFRELTQ